MPRLSIPAVLLALLPVLLLTPIPGCGKNDVKQVVVYTAVDQVFSEPVLKEFEKQTGIKVLPVYDVEAAKTTGLINRLIAEKERPKADVFWSNEYAQMIVLKNNGVLTPYNSPSAVDIPAQFRDPENYWTGFGARARVLIINTDLVAEKDYPRSIYDLLSPAFKGEVGIANPVFGTTASHAAALFLSLGEAQAERYFQDLLANGVHIVDGNSVVRDMVASGELKAGLTDTDDAFGALQNHQPVKMIFPDQEGMGTLLIPNTAGMVKGCPHPEAARALLDYVLSRDVEKALAGSGSRQIPLRDGVPAPADMPPYKELTVMNVAPAGVADKIAVSSVWVQQNFYQK
jgi:iron(III) transport system substrate-binding protein